MDTIRSNSVITIPNLAAGLHLIRSFKTILLVSNSDIMPGQSGQVHIYTAPGVTAFVNYLFFVSQ